MQKHRSIALLLLNVQVLTYVVFRLYVRPSVQQHSSGLCASVIRCKVKSSPTILIERGEERGDTQIEKNDMLETIWYKYDGLEVVICLHVVFIHTVHNYYSIYDFCILCPFHHTKTFKH